MNINNNNNYQSKQESRIYYWDMVGVDSEIAEVFKKQVDQLRQGDLSGGLRFHKLKGSEVYSISTNDKSRLLFAKITMLGKKCFLFLEALPDHEYNNSKYVHKGNLKQFLKEKIENGAFRDYDFIDVIDEEKKELINALKSSDSSSIKPLNLFFDRYIEFTDSQNNAMQAKLPLKLQGNAGSGKTLIGVKMLHVESQRKCEKPLLYITQQKDLVRKAKGEWSKLPSFPHQQKVEFATYKDAAGFLENSVGVEKFLAWLSSSERKLEIKEAVKLLMNSAKDKKQIYEELRILSGLSEKTYLELGDRGALFSDQNDRVRIIKIYEAYLEHLKSAKPQEYDLSLDTSLIFKEEYGLIVVDEAQDFSLGQLKSITEKAENQRIVYLVDLNQSIHDRYSKFLLFNTHILKNTKLSEVSLPTSFRCPPSHMDVANHLRYIGFQITGGLSEKDQLAFLKKPDQSIGGEGQVIWYSSLNDIEQKTMEKLQELSDSVNFAIVTPECFKDEVRKVFPKQKLIFNPEEIKGQEYETVLVYRLMKNEELRVVNKKINEGNIELEFDPNKEVNRAKQGKGHPEHAEALNKAHVALTRSLKNMFVIEPEENNLLGSTIRGNFTKSQPVTIEISKSSKEDWKKMEESLTERGLTKQAETIRKQFEEEKTEESKTIQKAQPKKKKKKKTTNDNSFLNHLKSVFKGGAYDLVLKELKFTEEESPSGFKIFCKACEMGQTTVVDHMLNYPDIMKYLNQKDVERNATPLMFAISNGHLPVSKLLVEWGAEPFTRNKCGHSPLSLACEKGYSEVVIEILKDVNALKYVNQRYGENETTLMSLALKSGSQEIIDRLLDFDIDLLSVDKSNESAFSLACQNGMMKVADKALKMPKVLGCINQKYGKKKETLLYKLFDYRAFRGKAPITNTVLEILEKGADITLTFGKYKYSILFLACEFGEEAIVDKLLENPKAIKLLNSLNGEHKASPMQIACCKGFPKIAQKLLKAGANPFQETTRGSLPLLVAINSGFDELVKEIITHDHFPKFINDCHAARNNILLITAINNKNVPIAKALLQANVDPFIADKNKLTPLNLACACGCVELIEEILKNPKISDPKNLKNNKISDLLENLIRYKQRGGEVSISDVAIKLLKKGAECGQNDKIDPSVLFSASEIGDDKLVEELLKTSSAPEMLNEEVGTNQATALDIACYNQHETTAIKLLDAGANPFVCDNKKPSPIFLACRYGFMNFLKKVMDLEHFLVDQPTGPDLETPLHVACSNDYADLVEVLLDKGADPFMADSKGDTPFCVACENGLDRIVDQMIKHPKVPENINKQYGFGKATPLMLACKNKHSLIAEKLMKKGADPFIMGKRSMSPLAEAVEIGLENVVDCMMQHKNFSDNIETLVSPMKMSLLQMACDTNNVSIALKLLEAKANPFAISIDGSSPYSVVCEIGLDKVFDEMITLESVKQRINSPIGPEKETPFFLACAGNSAYIASKLLQFVNDPFKVEQCGASPFSIAISKEAFEALDIVLDHPKVPEFINQKLGNNEETPLELILAYKANGGKARISKVAVKMLEKGADLPFQIAGDQSPLFVAAKNGEEELVDAILKTPKGLEMLNQGGGKNKSTPLQIACRKDHSAIALKLLSCGADPFYVSPCGSTPLIYACFRGLKEVVMKIAERNDFNTMINQPIGDDKRTPLYCACLGPDESLAVELLKRGADPFSLTTIGKSPFHVACSKGSVALLREILKHPKISDHIDSKVTSPLLNINNLTPIEIAQQKGHKEVEEMFKQFLSK